MRGGSTWATPGVFWSPVTKLSKRAEVAGSVDLADHLEGTVEPWAEALGQQVIGLLRGRSRGVLAGVRQPETHAEEGQSDNDDQGEAEHGEDGRPSLDDGSPPLPERASPPITSHGRPWPGLGVRSQHPSVATRQRLVAVEAEHGGQQGERREHREQDDERGPERDPVEEGEAEGEHAEQGDADRQAGDEDGPPDVLSARTAASSGLRPASSSRRWRFTMNRE